MREIIIPEGYEEVTEGTIEESDLTLIGGRFGWWEWGTKPIFSPPLSPQTEIKDFQLIVRRVAK